MHWYNPVLLLEGGKTERRVRASSFGTAGLLLALTVCHLHNHADLTKKRKKKKKQGEQKGSKGITVRITQMQTTWQRCPTTCTHASYSHGNCTLPCSMCSLTPSLPHSRSPFTSLDALYFLNGTTSAQQVQVRDTPEGILHPRVTFFAWTVRVLRLHLSALISFWSKEQNAGQKCKFRCFFFPCGDFYVCFIHSSLSQYCVRVHSSSTLCTQPLCVFLKCVFKWIFWLLNKRRVHVQDSPPPDWEEICAPFQLKSLDLASMYSYPFILSWNLPWPSSTHRGMFHLFDVQVLPSPDVFIRNLHTAERLRGQFRTVWVVVLKM